MDAMNVALTALRANFERADVTANNVANVNTNDFKKSRAILEETDPSGVKVSISRVDTPGMPLPFDEKGGVHESSNVTLEEELVDLIVTQRATEAAVKTITTKDGMEQSLIDIFA
jgi:flagellar basal-body rod protein FlgC